VVGYSLTGSRDDICGQQSRSEGTELLPAIAFVDIPATPPEASLGARAAVRVAIVFDDGASDKYGEPENQGDNEELHDQSEPPGLIQDRLPAPTQRVAPSASAI
jgi:hypothetical protein